MIAVACPGCGAVAQVEGGAKDARCAQCGRGLVTEATEGMSRPPAPAVADDTVRPAGPDRPGVVTAGTDSADPTDQRSHDSGELCSFLAPPQADDELGRLGNYRILRVVGTGGMGIVFEAEDIHLRRRVALKILSPVLGSSKTARQRFLREARAVAAIEHENVVAVHQVGEDRGIPFLAMQFLKGETLDDRAHRAPLSLPEVVRIGREIALGLAAAHKQGLVHRDVKPSNTWIEAGTGRAKILDFGLARSEGADAQLTRDGAVIGTPAYMSPEQSRGQPATFRSDLFSLGSVLYRLSTGRQPFKGNDTVDTLMAVATADPSAPRTLNPAIPPALDTLIMHLLAKQPEARPESARAVAEALARIEAEPAPAVEASPLTPAPLDPLPTVPVHSAVPAASRRRTAWIAAAIAGLAALVLLARILPRPWNTGRAPSPVTPVGERPESALDQIDPESVPEADRIAGLGKELVAVLGQRGAPSVQGLDISPDGTLVAALGAQFDAHIWDVRTGQERAAFSCRRVIFAPDGASLVTADATGIQFRNLDGIVTRTLPKTEGEEIYALDFSADGKWLVCGGSKPGKKKLRHEGVVRTCDVSTGKPITEFTGMGHTVYAVKAARDGSRVAAMASDHAVHVWNVATHKELKFEPSRTIGNVTSILHSMRASLIDFSPDSRTLAFARRNTVRRVGVESGTELAAFSGFAGTIHGISYAPDGDRLVVSDSRGVVSVCDVSGTRLREWQMPGVVNDVAFASDGRHVAVANFNGTVAILRLSPPVD